MAETHVLSALTKKRSEVSGEIKHYEKLLKQSKLNLQSIDQTIHIFDDTYDLRTIKAKRVHKERYFKTGEAKVLILDMLRTATEPLCTNTIAKKLASNKGIVTLHIKNGTWEVAELACTEEENPKCLSNPEYFSELKKRFPKVSEEIFSEK